MDGKISSIVIEVSKKDRKSHWDLLKIAQSIIQRKHKAVGNFEILSLTYNPELDIYTAYYVNPNGRTKPPGVGESGK
jgi:hypothetical protein